MTQSVPSSKSNTLSITDAVCIIVGIVVGPGIFEASSSIARSVTSLETLLAVWMIGGLLSWSGMLCYGELASRYPRNGGEYVWLEVAYGRRIADLFLWADVTIVRPGAIAAMAFPAARYCQAIAPSMPLSETSLAAFIVAVFSILNIAGFYMGKTIQNALTILTIGALVVIIAAGALETPAPYAKDAILLQDSASDFGLALILVLFAYGGWNEIANVAADIKQESRGLYYASMISLGITTLLYLSINFVFVRLLGFSAYSSAHIPVIDGLQRIFPASAITVVYGVIIVSCLGTIQGMIFTGARLYSYLPIWKLNTSELTRSQLTFSYLAQGLIAVIITALSSSFMNAVVYTTTVVWIFFLLKGLSACIMRWRIKTPPSFQMPLYPLPVVVFCGSCLYLAYSALMYSPRGSITSLGIVGLGFLLHPLRRALKDSGG